MSIVDIKQGILRPSDLLADAAQEINAADERWADHQKQDENFKSRMLRYAFNLFPPFRTSGAWLTQISADVRYVRLKIPVKLKTRNYVGTLCGGNMYSAVDGVYMVMLIKNLGNDYLVWDKAATIRYKKPANGTLFADFRLTEGELQEIKYEVARQGKIDREYLIQLVDESDTVCAEVTKTIHIKQKVA